MNAHLLLLRAASDPKQEPVQATSFFTLVERTERIYLQGLNQGGKEISEQS